MVLSRDFKASENDFTFLEGMPPLPNPFIGSPLSKEFAGIFSLIASAAEIIVVGLRVSKIALREPKECACLDKMFKNNLY